MRVFLLGNGYKPQVPELLTTMLPSLRQHCTIVVQDLAQQVDLSQFEADIALVLGGDGAILRAVRQMGYRQIPVLGINFGKLGFLADLQPDEVIASWQRILNHDYAIARHLMFECTVEDRCFLGLNEVVVRSAPPFHLINLDLQIDGVPVSTFSGDGLIVSTPVGSTAQSLSAGGPILRQDLQAFVITPICPHTLTYRPLVDAADKVYGIRLQPGLGTASLIVDGQIHVDLTPAHAIQVRAAPVQFQLIKMPGHGYYKTLRDKLHWGTAPGQKREPS